MRNYDAKDKWDAEEAERLGAPPWMLDLLSLNPEYVFWGPHEDYMARRGRDEGPDELGRKHDHGWESRILIPSWSDFDWELDELNECVHWYFEINRDSKRCPLCDGTGYHPDAQWVSESFYTHSSPFKPQSESELRSETFLAGFTGSYGPQCVHGRNTYPDDAILAKYGPDFTEFCQDMRERGCGWVELPLHADEIAALKANNRDPYPGRLGHDAINRSILVRARCKRFGIPVTCPDCDGHGDVFTDPDCHLTLVLWMLHPRKGCSRGVEIKRVGQDDLPAVYAWLRAAAQRNAERFAKIPESVEA